MTQIRMIRTLLRAQPMPLPPATVRKHREMNPRACDAIEVREPDDGGLLLVVPGLS